MTFLGNTFPLSLSELCPLALIDRNNPTALKLAEGFKFLVRVRKEPNLIVVVGGDGFMLRSIRKLWHKRLPFFGINAGHYGFLLNQASVVESGFPVELQVYHLPLLEVEMTTVSGKIKRLLAFNDVSVERAKSSSAWLSVKIDGVERLKKLIGDGILVATPAGSTAYAMAMKASPLPLNAQALVMVGSNISSPRDFKPCYLPLSSQIEFQVLDTLRRQLFGVADGVRYGKVRQLKVCVSSSASVQLAFAGDHSLTEKLASIQFSAKGE